MYAALGGLIVGLVALMIMPAVWNRAVRLTTRRYRAELPINLDEVKAERDQLRAEHALSARRLEQEAEAARARASEQMGEAGRLWGALEAARLKREADEADELARRTALEATIATLEGRIAGLDADVTARDERIAAQAAELVATRDRLEAELAATRDRLEADLAHTRATLEAELAAARATIEAQDRDIRGYADLAVDLDRRIAETKMDLASALSQGEILRGKLANMTQEKHAETARAAQIDSELRGRDAAVAREKQKVDALEAKVDRMRADLADRDEALESRTRDAARLESELARERQRTTDLVEALNEAKRRETARGEPEPDGRDNIDKALAAAEQQRTELERRLVVALGERDRQAARLAELERLQADFDQRIARENATLRDTLAEVANRVVGLGERSTGERAMGERALAERGRAGADVT